MLTLGLITLCRLNYAQFCTLPTKLFLLYSLIDTLPPNNIIFTFYHLIECQEGSTFLSYEAFNLRLDEEVETFGCCALVGNLIQ